MSWMSLFKRTRWWRLHEAVDSWYEGSEWVYTFPDMTRATIADNTIDTFEKWKAYRVPARTP